MSTKLQWRVLYRQFLFRLMDVELLSVSARGDASTLLGQIGSLLIAVSLLLSWFAISIGAGIARRGGAAPVWAVEHFLISLTMLVVGLFAVLNWESNFPDRRDVMVLGPLPIRGWTLMAAKLAAGFSALGLVIAALNSLAGFAWPLMVAPAGCGAVATARFVAAFWIALAAAGTFFYCVVLAVQGIAAQLPRRWYLRVSSGLQIAALVLFFGAFCQQSPGATAWLPSRWFMGLLSELSGLFPAEGHALMAPLARRAVIGLAAAVLAAAGAFLLSYFRTLRKIVEEPDIVPGSRGGMWLPRFGSLPQTALAQFVIRTLLRSRQHRVIVSFYLGGGFAIVAVYLAIMREGTHLTALDLLHRVDAPVLGAGMVMLCAAWLGVRTVFSLPLDLRANWVFRVTPTPECGPAVRRALLALTVVPVGAAWMAVLPWFWPWLPVAAHLVTLGLLGGVLAEVSLRSFGKIPFTCSYMPGKSKVHMVFWLGVVPVVIAIHKAGVLERGAMATPLGWCAMVVGLAAAVLAARKVARRSGEEIRFEEPAPAELIVLSLEA